MDFTLSRQAVPVFGVGWLRDRSSRNSKSEKSQWRYSMESFEYGIQEESLLTTDTGKR